MKRYKNTFGPPHLKTEWLTLPNILQGLTMGLFKYEDIPEEIKSDLQPYLAKRKETAT